jgi:hypothetical protein
MNMLLRLRKPEAQVRAKAQRQSLKSAIAKAHTVTMRPPCQPPNRVTVLTGLRAILQSQALRVTRD